MEAETLGHLLRAGVMVVAMLWAMWPVLSAVMRGEAI